MFAEVDPEHLDADETPTDPSELLITTESVRLRAVRPIDAASYQDAGVADWIRKTSSRLAMRYGLRLRKGESEWSGGAAWAVLTFSVHRSTPLSRVLEFNDSLRALLEHDPATLDESAAWELIRAGLPQGIVGCPESHWLEAKRAPYRLSNVIDQLELAKDLSALANSGGGILVVGAKTTHRDGIDVVSSLSPVGTEFAQPSKYRSVLRSRLYPRIQGLTIFLAKVTQSQVVLGIRVPRQPTNNLPILVVGMPSMRGDRLEGSYWGLFRRVGEDSTPVVVEAVHTALRGGIL